MAISRIGHGAARAETIAVMIPAATNANVETRRTASSSESPGQSHKTMHPSRAMIVPSRNVVVVRRGIDEESGFKIAKFAADVLGVLGK